MDYETKKNNCYSVYGSYDGILDFRLWWCIRQRAERSGQGSRRNSERRSASGKIPGDGYGTSGRKNESECKDSERNVI